MIDQKPIHAPFIPQARSPGPHRLEGPHIPLGPPHWIFIAGEGVKVDVLAVVKPLQPVHDLQSHALVY